MPVGLRLAALGLCLLACRRAPPLPPPAAAPVVAAPVLVSAVPGDARSRYLEASVAERRGELDRAEAAYRWVTRLDASSPWAWLALGRFLERQRRWDEALDAYQRAVNRAPLEAETHLALGSCRVRSGDAAGGVEPLRIASSLGHSGGHHLYARALIMTGRRDAARAVLDTWLAADSTPSERLERARLSYELGADDAVVDDLMAADWLTAPAPAGDMLRDAAQRSCRIGDAWMVARGNALESRADPEYRTVAARIAERAVDPWMFQEADPDAPPGRVAALLAQAGRGEAARAAAPLAVRVSVAAQWVDEDRDVALILIEDAPSDDRSAAHIRAVAERVGSPVVRCDPKVAPAPGCEGLPAAWSLWRAFPTRADAIDTLEDRARACGDADAQAHVAQVRRWLRR